MSEFLLPLKDYFHYPEHMWVFLPLLLMCLLASYTDFKEHKIRQKMVSVFLVIRFLLLFWYPVSLDTALGGLVGFSLLFGPAFVLNTNHMAGDIKLAFVIGLWLGAVPMFTAWVVAILWLIVGIVIVGPVLKRGKIVPFAPCLSIGVVATLLLPRMMGW